MFRTESEILHLCSGGALFSDQAGEGWAVECVVWQWAVTRHRWVATDLSSKACILWYCLQSARGWVAPVGSWSEWWWGPIWFLPYVFIKRLFLLLPRNWVDFFVDCCVVVSFRLSGGLQMWLQFPKALIGARLQLSAVSITPVLSNVFERLISLRLVAFWRDLVSCHLASTHKERIWVPVMLFWTSSVLVR